MTSLGPPTRVVPVSIAAKEDDPDGTVTDVPCTVRAVVDRILETFEFQLRQSGLTCQGQDPI
jgi:hypothetical protein